MKDDTFIPLRKCWVQRLYGTVFLDQQVVVKERFRKAYRHPTLDDKLTKERIGWVRLTAFFHEKRQTTEMATHAQTPRLGSDLATMCYGLPSLKPCRRRGACSGRASAVWTHR